MFALADEPAFIAVSHWIKSITHFQVQYNVMEIITVLASFYQ